MARPDTVSRAAHERAGRRAEWLAELLLRAKGYSILARRFRSGKGEIDLVARRGATLAFVEVKARPSHEQAAIAITPTGEKRIAAAAVIFLSRHPELSPEMVRYDLITVAGLWPRHHKDAFRPAPDSRDPAALF
ncbi:YraN family protein [Parvularcula marina]|uniref:YraN family protein n=1 Tax=Parvularcula marina TaxID=2292771 RepID=UPI0035176044